MNHVSVSQPAGERGIALITALLATMLLLALGVAVVSSTTNDTTTTKVQRVGEQAFFIADAGIGIARRAITVALQEEIDRIRSGEETFYAAPTSAGPNKFPNVQVIPSPRFRIDFDRAKRRVNHQRNVTEAVRFDQGLRSSRVVGIVLERYNPAGPRHFETVGKYQRRDTAARLHDQTGPSVEHFSQEVVQQVRRAGESPHRGQRPLQPYQ